jgi:hypothetical protein
MDKQRYKNGFIGQYIRESYILQDNRTVQKTIVLPYKIYGTKEKRLSERVEAQKQYRLATRRFIAVYQRHEEIGIFLQEAKAVGDIAKMEYLSHLYMENISDLMHSINLMDQAKKRLNMYIADIKGDNVNVLKAKKQQK